METKTTPLNDGFVFPAEFEKQDSMWLSWPHNKDTWPGKIESIYNPYMDFILEIADHQKVCINVDDQKMEEDARNKLQKRASDSDGYDVSFLSNIQFFHHPTNDAWCRDHGPAFVINRERQKKSIVNWGYNAWGDKYPPYDLDNKIPLLIAKEKRLKVYNPGIIMEGGSVEFNGKGTVMTTTSCLLNPNRNPELTQTEIENYLINYYGAENVLWLGDGILGDDTDGHIDDITRFVNEDTVITTLESNRHDANYLPLRENLKMLKTMRLETGKQLNIAELPMPNAIYYDGVRLPASYANFYISNAKVIVPVFRDSEMDDRVLGILENCFPERQVVGIDSTDLVWGLGSFHCLSQQEPLI